MDKEEKTIAEIVGALRHLEITIQGSPSVKDVAKQTGYSNGMTQIYLKRALEQGLITQNKKGKYMSWEFARALTYTSKGK